MLKVRFLFALPRTLLEGLYNVKCFLGVCIFLLVNGLTTGYADAQLQNGLVGYWSFNEGTGTAAMDSSGNGNTGMLLHGPTWSSGKSGTALGFDGVNDYVEIPHAQSLNLSEALTVSVWIDNDTLMDSGLSQDQYRIIASKGWPLDSGSWSLAWRANDGALFFFVGRDTSYRYVRFPYDNSQAGIWHLVTAVLDSGTISLYQDGVLKAGPVGIDSSTILTDTSPLRIGSLGESSNSVRNWDGFIDELRFYNRALSAAEIASLYQQDNQSFNFSLANSMNMSVTQGFSVTNSITASLVSGLPQPVSFSVSGLPEGASGSFSKTTCTPTCSSLLTIATAESTPAGTYTVIVTGTGEGVTKTTSFTLTVNSSSGTFNFSLSNDGNKSVTQGRSIASTITATLSSASSQAVSFSTSGLPTGATASYTTSTSCNPTCSRTLNIATAASTPTGTYTITVTGAGGEVNKNTSFSLTVTSTASTAITSPAQGTSFSPGQTVTATGSGTNLVWDIDLIGDDLPSFKTGTGPSITFTVPTTATSSQLVRIILTGSGGSVTRDYNIVIGDSPSTPASSTVATPSITPNGGSFTGFASVTLQSATSDASIYYTTDGSAPTQSSTLYLGPIALTSNAVLNAKAFKSGSNPSAVASASFTVGTPLAQLALTWQDNADDEDNFAIERKTGTSGTYSQITMTAMNVTSYVDTSVTRGATYCYRVQAVNSAGASSYTNEACKTLP
jgi:hypothetical protein